MLAFKGIAQHVTWKLLVCAAHILRGYDRHRQGNQYTQPVLAAGFRIRRGRDCRVPNSPHLQNVVRMPEPKVDEDRFIRMNNPRASQDEQRKELAKNVCICVARDRRMESSYSQSLN